MGEKNQLKNWKVTAWLASPLCGDAPMLDAILAWELSLRLGAKHAKKTGRWTPASEIERMPIPIAIRRMNGFDIYCASDPIVPVPEIPEQVVHISKRFETSKLALALAPEHRKTILTASGPYKSRFTPERVRYVPCVCWIVCGDREGMNKLLKKVTSIGKHRNIGYGAVMQWEYEEMAEGYENCNAILAPHQGKRVLMRTIPMDALPENVCGYRVSFGGYMPPYWHPEMQRKVAQPC
jgi:hypothetical protein